MLELNPGKRVKFAQLDRPNNTTDTELGRRE